MKYLYIIISFLFFCISQFTYATTYTVTSKSEVPQGWSWNTTETIYSIGSDTYALVPRNWLGGGGGGGDWLPSNATSAGGWAENLIDNGEGEWFFKKLREWNVWLDDIPKIIVNLIEFLLGIAGAISVVVIIYGALQMQLNSGIMGKSDDKWRKIIMGGIVGFILSISSWFIITKFVEIISNG